MHTSSTPQNIHNITGQDSPLRIITETQTSDSIDFSAFLAKDFNVKTWINEALSSVTSLHSFPDETNEQIQSNEQRLLKLENHASKITEKLQHLNQDVSLRLENTIEGVMKNMPTIISELQMTQQSSENLKRGISLVKSSLGKIEDNTGKAVERLKYLDLVKTRMELSRNVLREAENWSNLETEASTIFASQDYQKAAVRLQEAEKSLVIFQNTPEYDERRKLLTELQNQLEATVSPQLVAALSQHDISACQKFYLIFSQIGRKKEFCNYYYGSRKAPLVKMWQNAKFTDVSQIITTATPSTATGNINALQDRPPSPKTQKKFVEYWQEFLQELFVVLNEEYTWCGNVFPDTNETLIALIENIFNSLKPPLSARLAGLVEHYNEQCLIEIINAFIVSENFGRQMEKVLFNPIQIGSAGSRNLTANGTVGGGAESFLSKVNLATWGQMVFEPFLEYQHDYSEFEKNYLVDMLKRSIEEKRKSGTDDLARIMADNVGKIFSLAESGLQRCMALTHGFSGVGLVDVLNYYFSEVVKEYQTLLDQLRVDCGLKEDTRSSMSSTSTSLAQDYFDYDQDRLQQEDWSNFQIGLRLLATCKLASDRLNALEMLTKTTLSTVKTLIDHDLPDDHLEWYERRSPTVPDYNKSFSIGTQSSLHLLRQSTLNSYQLYDLLTNLESRQLLEPSIKSIETFIKSCQRFVYDTIFLPIVKHLVNLPTMEIWKAATEPVQVSPFNLEMPTFSLSPSEYITRVGEHLLTLPQQFEVYADDKSLAFSIRSLPYSDEVPMQPIDNKEEGEKRDITIEEFVTTNDSKASVDVESLQPSITIASENGATLAIDEDKINTNLSVISNSSSQLIDQEEMSTEEVTHAWITSVARGTMHALLERILAIPQLSSHGTQQLLTDLGYLTNVLSALDILPTRELFMAVKVLEMDEDKVFKLLRGKVGVDNNPSVVVDEVEKNEDEFTDAGDREVLVKVAGVRGIKLLNLGFLPL
ncbi:14319_t:CDS:1 [Acaulospora morrowiae]|uniref:Conserved oligomeric Golgi complex subunit 7 n=1 Tax=Acaulospora morrowiae TaxID=94023 RepID=A0A9N8YUJ3_9GLOM|nr:14319_t:CDS:1 [Acaulospora morrowiae]